MEIDHEFDDRVTIPRAMVFFDGSCRLCTAEIRNIESFDRKKQFVYIDCSPPDFSPGNFGIHDVTRGEMMKSMHVWLPSRRWATGVDAFGVLYRAIGFDTVARLWSSKSTRPISRRVYRFIVRNRQIISRLGGPILVNRLFGLLARQSHSRDCAGTCRKQEFRKAADPHSISFTRSSK